MDGMRKKDFERIGATMADLRAATLAIAQDRLDSRQLAQVAQAHDSAARELAAVLARQNARFDSARFLASCRGDRLPGQAAKKD